MVKARTEGKVKEGKAKAVKGTLCHCGCGEMAVKTFRQGHDSRFHGRVRKLKDGRLSMAELKKELGTKGAYAIKFYEAEVGPKKLRKKAVKAAV